jgi:hypothetical protein
MDAADQVRDFAYRTYIQPARKTGQEIVRIRCGDIHGALEGTGEYLLVCNSLLAKKFRHEHKLELVGTEGSLLSLTLVITFRLLSL